MIRKLTEADRELCLEFVSSQPAENLFIIGDIEAFGFDTEFQDVWADFDINGRLRGVLLRYYKNYIAYAPESFDAVGFADIIKNDQEAQMVSGIVQIIAPLIDHLKSEICSERTLFYAKCEDNSMLDKNLDVSKVREATLEDIDRLLELRGSIPEFSEVGSNPDSVKHAMQTGVARTFYIEDDGKMVSAASTTAENTYAAMVVAVCTLENYKKRGYATACLTKLARELLSEHKMLCLFYDNPEAGKIYKRLGFVDIGQWTMYHLNEHK